MFHRSLVLSAVALGVLSFTLPGRAQGQPDTPESPPSESDDAPNAPEKSEAPQTSAAGYAYSDQPVRSSGTTRRGRYRKSGPVVNTPGFEVSGDGGSRFFVQLSQSVPVEERKAQGSITYVLKGASPRVWNNTNPLVTVHFNTPATRARLVPRGKDLLFVLELRAAVTPTWKMTETRDKGALLTIDFPKGDYLAAIVPEAPSQRPEAKPAPDAPAAKRQGSVKP